MQSPNSIFSNQSRRNNYISFSKYNLYALGEGTNTIASSSDYGVTFTNGSATIFTTSGNALICFKNTFIAGGSGTYSLAYFENNNWIPVNSSLDIFSKVNGFCLSKKNNQDIIIAVGEGNHKIAYSYDLGKSWLLFSSSFFTTSCNAIQNNGKTLVGVGVSTLGNVAYSNNNGNTWVFSSTSLDVKGNCVYWDGDKWWIGGQGTSSSLSYSFDLVSFVDIGNSLLSEVKSIDSNTHNALFVAVGTGASHSIMTSNTFGVTWTGRGKTIFDVGNSVKWNGKFWVACGSSVSCSIAYSTTGIVWTPCASSLSTFSTSGNAVLSNFENNTSITVNQHHVIVLGTGSNGIAYSDNNNDLIFTGLGTSIFTTGNRGLYTGLYIALGAGNNTVAVSYTGTEWIGLGTTIFSTAGRDICYFNKKYIATGEGLNTFAYSYDALYWVGEGITMFSYGVAISNNDTVIVACGVGDYDNMAYSSDGLNWTGLGYTLFDVYANGVATDGINWVCAGQGSVNTLAFSTDAITWTGLGTTVFSTYGSNVTWNGKLYMAVGVGTTKVASSPDGQVWTLLTISLSFASDIAYHDGYWIISGNNTYFSYNNGVTWILASTSGLFSSSNGVISFSRGPYRYGMVTTAEQLDISSDVYSEGFQNLSIKI
jgi:hypothetical protein